MKKPLLIVFFVLTACALGVYASLYVPAYFQEKNWHIRHQSAAERTIAPEKELDAKFGKRIKRKADELARLGIKGDERQRLMSQESSAALAEFNKVRASGYTVPFDEKTLPLDPK